MFRSYLMIALRNLSRNRLHTFINILGLSIGIAVSLLAFVFVLDEWSFDRFHSNKDRLYRLNKIVVGNDGSTHLNAETSGLMGPAMVDEFPEVESIVRYQPWYNPIMLINDDTKLELNEMDAVFVDSTFFEVFDFSLVRGNPKTVLNRPSTMVLTTNVSEALFGKEDPIGKTVTGINGLEFEITGIVKEPPRNSHIQFDALISWSTTVPQLGPLNYLWMNNWITQGITTYVLLMPGTNVEYIQPKFARLIQDHLPERADSYHLYLQPFSAMYLEANEVKYHRMAKSGSKKYIYIFSIIAGFILFIACINYINISTSKATRRAREVGMRKSLGASKIQLIQQFLGESFLLSFLSALFAFALLYITIPYFNVLSGKSLPFELLLDRKLVAGMLILTILISVISGLYPAFIISAFRPSEVLKSTAKSKISGHLPRNILITFQFTISIVILACTLLVYRQMHFVQSKDLGFDKENILVLNLTNEIMENGKTFEQEVANHYAVESTSLCAMALGQGGWTQYIMPEGFPPDEIETRMFQVDGNFQETYGFELAMGRFFDVPSIAGDSTAVVINEALAKQLHWDNPLEKTIKFNETAIARNVIGVAKDFNFHALYEEVQPVVMWISLSPARNLSIRFSGNPSELLSFLETKWKQFESVYPFKYYFMDDAFARQYNSDGKLFQTIIIFAGLSILIACLGLYGLVSFTIEQRTREFGIRKVFGASVTGLNFMVTKKFLRLVFLAGVIAVPLVIPLMEQWLDKFAYKIALSPSDFVIAIGLTLIITLITVSIQVIKAARMDPAKALRYE